jgi:hypothetical protein
VYSLRLSDSKPMALAMEVLSPGAGQGELKLTHYRLLLHFEVGTAPLTMAKGKTGAPVQTDSDRTFSVCPVRRDTQVCTKALLPSHPTARGGSCLATGADVT